MWGGLAPVPVQFGFRRQRVVAVLQSERHLALESEPRGGLGHALPYLIPDFWTATIIAMVVVFVELWAIAWIQNRWMQTPFWRATLQVVVGGGLVLAVGVLIGSG